VRHVEQVMGTAVSIDIADPLPRAAVTGLIEDVCAWLHEVDRRFSTYREDSEVNRLHRGELPAKAFSTDLQWVLDACADLWKETDGYFDAFATGRLDPSGYVKGWAIELASKRLAAGGSRHHCVNGGGDIRTRGRTAAGDRWRVGIRHPWEADRLSWVLEVSDLAVATSGTYERGDHVMNPHAGGPARGLRSVTVVGPDLALADAYATAALAMGEPGVTWLAGLTSRGYESAAVTDDGRAFRSDRLPVAATIDRGLKSA
jgi:thiamine biosynthesis lipoprotein